MYDTVFIFASAYILTSNDEYAEFSLGNRGKEYSKLSTFDLSLLKKHEQILEGKEI